MGNSKSKFEVGVVYLMTFITDSSLRVPFRCIGRTDKMVRLERLDGSEKVFRMIQTSQGVEYVSYASYSMAPSIYSDRVLKLDRKENLGFLLDSLEGLKMEFEYNPEEDPIHKEFDLEGFHFIVKVEFRVMVKNFTMATLCQPSEADFDYYEKRITDFSVSLNDVAIDDALFLDLAEETIKDKL